MMSKLILLLAVLVAVAATAALASAGSRRYINLPGRRPNLPFSDAVLVGNTLYISGKIGLDPKTGQAPADLEQEAHLLLDDVKATLQAADMTMDDLVYVQVYGTDLSLWDKFNTIYRGYFKKDLPARAFIGGAELLRGGHFEMVGIAVKER